ncbi:MAG: response regulator [Bacteroidia bacterium]|nr:response regulator [Bacteroidia bacterium]MDW8302501.1 response regulator [Bacteroidia bacterium]
MDKHSHTLSFFVVEDNETYIMMLDHQIRKFISDYHLTPFKTGEECLKNLHLNPDFIILDYYLPGMNGIETLKKIHEKYPDMPVIMWSGQEDIHVAIECFEQGAYSYVVKDRNGISKIGKTIGYIQDKVRLRKENDILRERLKKKQRIIYGLFGLSLVLLITLIAISV